MIDAFLKVKTGEMLLTDIDKYWDQNSYATARIKNKNFIEIKEWQIMCRLIILREGFYKSSSQREFCFANFLFEPQSRR